MAGSPKFVWSPHLSNGRKKGAAGSFGCFFEDCTTQLYRDYFIQWSIRIPII